MDRRPRTFHAAALACLCVWAAAGCGPEVRAEFMARESYEPRLERTPPEQILLENGDLLRPYAVLGEISVSAVSSPKSPPDRYLRRALLEKAAAVGADAVIELKTEVVLKGTQVYTSNQFRDVWGQTYGGRKTASDHDRTVWSGLAVRFPKP